MSYLLYWKRSHFFKLMFCVATAALSQNPSEPGENCTCQRELALHMIFSFTP